MNVFERKEDRAEGWKVEEEEDNPYPYCTGNQNSGSFNEFLDFPLKFYINYKEKIIKCVNS